MNKNLNLPFNSTNAIGIDEAGRGPLAGPVVACAVLFPKDYDFNNLAGLNDSKKLSAKLRESLASKIKKDSIWGVGYSWQQEIDRINILQGTFSAMFRAILALYKKTQGNLALPLIIDGKQILPVNFTQKLPQKFEQYSVIGGDAKYLIIAAASIVAKVTRDNLMLKLAHRYPLYSFEKHKGYGTEKHILALKQHGPCKLHRLTFNKVKS